MFSVIDPFLGYGYSISDLPDRDEEKKTQGFVVYGDAKDRGHARPVDIRIVTLGGSTTTPHFIGCWPKQLYNVLRSNGVNATVYNGGVSGYSTAQELLKLLRDVLPLRPDIVISFNGINDVGYMHVMPSHPMIHVYLDNVMTSIQTDKVVTKSRKGAVAGVTYGDNITTTPCDSWLSNLRAMNALCAEFNVKFYSILQPTLGVGKYAASLCELKMLENYDSGMRNRYVPLLQSFYEGARKYASDTTYIIDQVDAFNGAFDLYHDCRHPNERGYHIIASNIFSILSSNKIPY